MKAVPEVPGRQQSVPASPIPSSPLPDAGRLTGKKLHLDYNSVSKATCYFTPQPDGEYELTDKNYIRFVKPNTGANELIGWKDTGLFFVYDAEIDGRRYVETEVSQISGFFTVGSVKSYPGVTPHGDGNYSLANKGLLEMKRR